MSDNDWNKVETREWNKLSPIELFMIGIISTYGEYSTMTPDQVWKKVRSLFNQDIIVADEKDL